MVVDNASTGGAKNKAKKVTQSSAMSKQATASNSKTLTKKKTLPKKLPASKGAKAKNSGEEKKEKPTTNKEMVAASTTSTSGGPRIQAQRKFAQAGNIYTGTVNQHLERPGPTREGDKLGAPAKKQASVKRPAPTLPASGTASTTSTSSATKKLKARPAFSPPPNKRPKTEDFLTFLCFRGTPALPPDLAYLNYPPLPDELSFMPKKKSVASNLTESITKASNGFIHSEEESLSKPSLPLQPPPGNSLPSSSSKSESKDSATTPPKASTSKANQKSAESLAENPTKGIRATASSVLLSKMNSGSSKATGKQNTSGPIQQSSKTAAATTTKTKPILSPTRSRLNEQDARFAMTALRSSFQYQRLASSKLTKKAKERTGILTRSKASVILSPGAKLCARKASGKFRGARKSPIISPSRNAPSPDIIFGVTSSSGRKRLPRSARSSSTESEDARKKKNSTKSTSEESVEEEDDDDASAKNTKNTRSNSSKEGRKKPKSTLLTGRSLRSGKELFSPSTCVTKEISEPNKKASVGRISERRVGTRSAQRMTKSPLRELPMWNNKKSKDDDDSESDDSEEESDDEKKKSTKLNKKKSDSTDEEDSKQNKGKKKPIADKNTKKLLAKNKQQSSSDDDSDDKRTPSTRAKGKRGEVPSKKGKVAQRRESAKPKSESEDESSEDDGKKKLRGRRGSVVTNKPKKKSSASEEEESSEDESVKKNNKKGVKTSSTGSRKKNKDESSEEEVIQKKSKGKKKEETDDENDEKESEDDRTTGKKSVVKSRVSKRGRGSKEETVEKKSQESSDEEDDESESDQKNKERTSLRSKRTAKKEEKEQVKKRPSRQTKETAALCLGLYKFTTDEEGSSEDDEKSKKKKDEQDEDVEGSSSSSETKFLEKHYNASLKKEQQEKSKKKSSQMKTRPKRKESLKEESEEEEDNVPSSSKSEQAKTKGKKKQAESKKKGKTATEDEDEKDDDSTEEEEKDDKKLPPPPSKESSPAASTKRKMRQTTPTVGDRKMPGAARKSAAIVSRRRSRYSSSSSSSKEEASSDADEEEEVTFSGEEKDEKQPVKDEERTKPPSKEPKAIATEMRRLVSESVSPPGEPGSARRREQSVETEQCRLESPPVQPSSSSSGEDSSADSSGEEGGNVSATTNKVTIAIQCDMDEDPEAEKLISPDAPTVESPPRRSPVAPQPPIIVEDDGSNDSVQEIGHVFATQPPQHPISSSTTSSASNSSTAASSSTFPGIFTAPAPPPPSSLDYNPFLSSFYTPLHLTPPAQPPPPNPYLSTHFQHLQQQQSSAGAATSSSIHMSNPLNTLSIPVSMPPHPLSHSHHHLGAHPMSFQSFQTSTIHHHIRTTHTNLDNISLVRPPAIPGFPHQPPLTRPLTGLWPQQPSHAASSSTSSTASSYSAFRVPHLVPPGQGQAATVIHHQSTTVTQLPVSIVQPQGSLFQPHHGMHHPHTPHQTHHHNHQQQPGPSSGQSMPSASCNRAAHSQDKKSHPKTHHSHQHQQQHRKCSGNQSSVEKKQQQPQPHQSTVQPPGYNIIKNLPNVSIVPKFDRNAQPQIIPGKSGQQPSTSSSSKTKKDDKKEEVKPTTKETASSSGLPPPPVEKKKPGRKKKVEQALILPQPTSPLTVRKDSTTPATYHPKKPLFKKEEGDPLNDGAGADGDQAAPSPAAAPSTSKKTSSKKASSKGSSGDKNSRSKSPPVEIPFKLPKMQPNGLREAPTFHPTDAEFEDPLKYIMKVQFIAGKYGMARIVPPKSFRPECNVEDDMRFTAYNHYVHRMWQRWGPNTAEAAAIVENVRGSGVDTDELPAIIGGLEIDLALLYRTVRSFGGLKEVIEKEKWARVADAMHVPKAAHDRASKLDGIYVKYVLPYEILSAVERDKLKKRVEKSWCKRKERILKIHEKEQGNSSHSSDSEASNGSSDDEMAEIDECIVKGKSTPLSSYYRVARNTQNMFFTGDKSSPSVDEVEEEYWRLVRERTQPVTVYSGSIDCAGGVGWGFPMPTNKGNHHPWNLKVLANNQGSVLRSMGHVMGATVPTLHVSMLFTTYCWYRDPHSLPWVEYLHSGADKIWYAVPPEEERSFRSVLSALMPLQVQKNKKIWLASDSAMVPPNLLLSRGVPLVKAVQRPGEFLVVFPKAFTSAVCTGYLISESVCFAYPSWLSSCLQTFQDIRESKEPPVFPQEKLLLSILQDARASLEVVRLAIPPTQEVVKEELSLRKKLISLGVKLGGKLLQKGNSSKESEGGKSASKSKAKKKRINGNSANSDTEEEVEQCYVCNYLLWISLVRNTKTDSAMCLKHAIEHFAKHKADVKKSVLLYDMDEAQLEDLISNASNRCGHQKPGSSSSASATT